MSILKVWDEETQKYIGIPAIKGEKGDKGDIGYSPQVDITTSQQTDGRNKMVITIVSKGESGEILTHSGEVIDGRDGETPQRGIDYWTVEDQQAIINEVLAAIPVAETTQF